MKCWRCKREFPDLAFSTCQECYDEIQDDEYLQDELEERSYLGDEEIDD